MYILKFGGTSVKNSEAIRNVISILRQREEKAVVVVSACSQVTNQLVSLIEFIESKKADTLFRTIQLIEETHLDICDEFQLSQNSRNFVKLSINKLSQIVQASTILGEVSPKFKDEIISYGERLSSKLITEVMKMAQITVSHIDSRDIISTNSHFGDACVDFAKTTKKAQVINTKLKTDQFVILGGFIASNDAQETTTLGRGGSDYTASVLGSVLNAEAIEIWTDVHGVLTSDPRLIPNVKQISNLSYREAAELAYFGAKVLHPKTITPAIEKNIPVYVKNTFEPDNYGTKIQSALVAERTIKSIAYRKSITVINIQSNRMLGAFGFLSKVFNVFETNECSVDIVTTSEVSISLTIDTPEKLPKIREELERFSTTDVKLNQAIIAAVGEGIRDTAGVSARFFNTIEGINITMVSVGASEVNLSIVVHEDDVEHAVKLLHDSFFSENLDHKLFKEIA
jgi:aspartate kinase